MKRIHIYLTEEQVAALDVEAAMTGLKRSEIVRRVVDGGLEEVEQYRKIMEKELIWIFSTR